ncbi:opioid-binding protein/cell adhesion molecule-like [Ptychodera flava]|uniref:opioid-binding protein/cell adhesion molecule-like n=1 Tax=Ptychodera flava TaxID=63121 RepID=UPI00396A7920
MVFGRFSFEIDFFSSAIPSPGTRGHSQSLFVEIPVDTLAYTGCSAQLNCSISEINATISWSVRVDGHYQQISLGKETYDPRYDITGDHLQGEFHLYMEDVQKSMESSYECGVTNGKDSATAELFVLDSGPTCCVRPGTNVIENADTAIFNCSIDLPDDTPGEVVWMKNDHEVARTKNKTNIYTKIFDRNEKGDMYTCFFEPQDASFCHGLQPFYCGENFTMNVQYPPAVNIMGSNNAVIEGDSYTRSCSVDANPMAHVQWTHWSITVENSAVLSLNNVRRDQSGIYTCQATNTFWDGSSGNGTDNFELDVQYHPELETEISGSASDTGQVITGNDIKVECKVTDSNPDVDTIRWNDASGNNWLIFEAASREDHGRYTCDASNTFWNGTIGSTSIDVFVDVQYPLRNTITCFAGRNSRHAKENKKLGN